MPNGLTTLEGKEAIELWRAGKDEWNAWVKENPNAMVDFEGVEFRSHPPGPVDFSEYEFPDGGVDFSYARFGDDGVSFSEAQFGDGGVDFQEAQFGDGAVYFREAWFGDDEVSFRRAQFDDGRVDFQEAKFGDGGVYFREARFGDGGVSFRRAQFGDGGVSFSNVQFGDGEVNFSEAQFGDGRFSFRDVHLGGSGANFSYAEFGRGGAFIRFAAPGLGDVAFDGACFGGQMHCQAGKLKDRDPQFAGHLSFQFAQFEGPAIIVGAFKLVDLRSTVTRGHLDLQNLHIQSLDRMARGPGKVLSANDRIAALRRLKELAESNRHHEDALRFFALERRTLLQSKQLHWTANVLEPFYDWVSNYGLLILRPVLGFIGVALIGALLFNWFPASIPCYNTADALGASVSNMLPFLSSPSGTGACGGMQSVLLQRTHGVLGYILLFLIGLGIRNRFRL